MTGDRPRTSQNRGCSPGDAVSPLAMSTSLHNNSVIYSSVKGRSSGTFDTFDTSGPGPQTSLELPDGKRPNPHTSIRLVSAQPTVFGL